MERGGLVVQGSTRECNEAIIVRRARLSDYEKIAAFIREAYGELAPFKGKERWNWQFVNNPYRVGNTGDVPVWIAERCGQVVGQIAVQAGVIEIDGVRYAAGWIVDVMILASYRGLGLGHQLLGAVAKECPILVMLTMAPATRRMAERLGAVNVGDVKHYARLTRLDGHTVERYFQRRTAHRPRIRSLVRMICGKFCGHSILAWMGNFLLPLRDSLAKRRRVEKRTSIAETHSFGSDVDELWQRLRQDFSVVFTRESRFLNWRFVECPQLKYRCFTASRAGRLVGYIVLRESEAVELPSGIIVDLIAARRDRATIEDLVAFAIDFFGKRKAAVQCASSIPEFSSVLRDFGFCTVRKQRPNCVVDESVLRERIEASSGEWLFSKADHDWDQVHVA